MPDETDYCVVQDAVLADDESTSAYEDSSSSDSNEMEIDVQHPSKKKRTRIETDMTKRRNTHIKCAFCNMTFDMELELEKHACYRDIFITATEMNRRQDRDDDRDVNESTTTVTIHPPPKDLCMSRDGNLSNHENCEIKRSKRDGERDVDESMTTATIHPEPIDLFMNWGANYPNQEKCDIKSSKRDGERDIDDKTTITSTTHPEPIDLFLNWGANYPNQEKCDNNSSDLEPMSLEINTPPENECQLDGSNKSETSKYQNAEDSSESVSYMSNCVDDSDFSLARLDPGKKSNISPTLFSENDSTQSHSQGEQLVSNEVSPSDQR